MFWETMYLPNPMGAVMEMGRKGENHRSGEQVVIVLGTGISGQNADHLAKTINEELLNLGVAVSDDMQEVFDEVGKEAVKKLKETSPKNEKSPQKGRYAKGWTYERGRSTYNNQSKVKGVVRNKTDPQLTHILEYGHPLVRNGEVVGNVEPIEHIGPVAEWCADEIDKRLSKKLGG